MPQLEEENTYIVQVFATFAPPEHRPLLVRLTNDATVAECIQRTLAKLTQDEPLATVPTNDSNEYVLGLAEGDGFPSANQRAFQPNSVVRQLPGLDFPYMLSLTYGKPQPLLSRPATQEQRRTNTASSASAAVTPHKTLTEQQVEDQRMRLDEVAKKRKENIQRIERRRAQMDIQAFHHAESYELRRQARLEDERKQALHKQAAIDAARDEEEADTVAEVAKTLPHSMDKRQHATSDSAVGGSPQTHTTTNAAGIPSPSPASNRTSAAADASSERQRKDAEKARVLKERDMEQLRERESRIQTAYHNLIAQLDARVLAAQTENLSKYEASRTLRFTIVRDEADLRSIAALETKCNIPKDAARDARSEKSTRRERDLLASTQCQREVQDQHVKRHDEAFSSWRDEHRSRQAQQSILLSNTQQGE